MRKIILSVAVIATMSLSSIAFTGNESNELIIITVADTEISFGVRGNCGMCKKTIEKAALSVEGVSSAKWDREKKKIDISFDADKTDELAIHKAIAASGYDTDKVASMDEAYGKLPGCCQYDHEMEMNQTGN